MAILRHFFQNLPIESLVPSMDVLGEVFTTSQYRSLSQGIAKMIKNSPLGQFVLKNDCSRPFSQNYPTTEFILSSMDV